MDSATRFVVDEAARTLGFRDGRLAVEWGWDEVGAVSCRRLSDGEGGVEWIDPALPSPLYAVGVAPIAADGSVGAEQLLTSLAPQTVHAPTVEASADGVATARWRMAPAGAPISLTWTIECHARHAVVRQWVEIVNTGSGPIRVTHLPVLSWALGRQPGR